MTKIEHIGVFLQSQLTKRGLTQIWLSRETGISKTLLNEIINAKRSVNAEYAFKFEKALRIKSEVWMKKQVDYDLFQIRNREKVKFLIHPGEILNDELNERGITVGEFAQISGISAEVLCGIISSALEIRPNVAVLLEEALHIDAMFWMNFQAAYLVDKVKMSNKS